MIRTRRYKTRVRDRKIRGARISRRKAVWRQLSLHDPIFTQIAVVLQPRGIADTTSLRMKFRTLAQKNARPGYPACDVLREVKSRLQRGELLSNIV